MSFTRTKYLVGIFVTFGLGLTAAAIIWFGASRAFEDGRTYLCFFDESVQWLNIDSPVKYRGVPVGRVSAIQVADNAELIEVRIRLHPDYTPEQTEKLVAFLKVTGITGSMYIELNLLQPFEQERYVRPEVETKLPVILTRRSGTQRMLNSVEHILDKLSELNLKRISDDIYALVGDSRLTLEKFNSLLDDPRVDSTLSAIEKSSRKLELVMNMAARDLEKTSGILDQVEGLVRESRQGARDGLKQASSGLEKMENMLDSGASAAAQLERNMRVLHRQLLLASRNLVSVMENINNLVEKLLQQPSQLLFGSEPEERRLKEAGGKK